MISILPVRTEPTNEHQIRASLTGGRLRRTARRIFGREREYASGREYAERVMTVGLANAYRLGPWM